MEKENMPEELHLKAKDFFGKFYKMYLYYWKAPTDMEGQDKWWSKFVNVVSDIWDECKDDTGQLDFDMQMFLFALMSCAEIRNRPASEAREHDRWYCIFDLMRKHGTHLPKTTEPPKEKI